MRCLKFGYVILLMFVGIGLGNMIVKASGPVPVKTAAPCDTTIVVKPNCDDADNLDPDVYQMWPGVVYFNPGTPSQTVVTGTLIVIEPGTEVICISGSVPPGTTTIYIGIPKAGTTVFTPACEGSNWFGGPSTPGPQGSTLVCSYNFGPCPLDPTSTVD